MITLNITKNIINKNNKWKEITLTLGKDKVDGGVIRIEEIDGISTVVYYPPDVDELEPIDLLTISE